MRYDRLFTKLYCTPLLLEAATRSGFEHSLNHFMEGNRPITAAELQALAPQIPQMRKTNEVSAKRRMDGLLEMQGRTALIHIDGAIDKHLSALEMFCFGGVDLNDVDAALATAAQDPAVQNIMLVINSPGGSVTGTPETAQRIAALAQAKNVFAFTDSMCCSAAYWLASQCDQIFATASASVGSIGVYMALLDTSRAMETAGRKVETIKDGSLKAAGAPWKSLSDSERAHFQEAVNNIGVLFRAAVTDKRPDISTETMQGQSLMGERARAAGLVDAIVPDLAAALAQF